jgi:hypothetical protein
MDPNADMLVGSFGITIDGGGSPITTGYKGDVQVPYDCVITGWTLTSDQIGSIQIDVWDCIYANYAPIASDSICGAVRPNITIGRKATDSALVGWDKQVSNGDILAFNVDSCDTITRATLVIRVVRL